MNRELLSVDKIGLVRFRGIQVSLVQIPFRFAHKKQGYSIRRFAMEETTKKLTFVIIFLSVVVVTLFGLAPAV